MTVWRFTLFACFGLTIVPAFSSYSASAEWKSLFNGRDLDGWTVVAGPKESWTVEDGLLHCTGKGQGWLSNDTEYANFELELEYRATPAANSGVYLRAPHGTGNPTYEGMEIQILDDHDPKYAKIEKWQHCGSLYHLAAAPPLVAKKAGEWQKMQIVCNGNRVQVKLNGEQLIDADLTTFEDKLKEHPGLKRDKGYVGLQNHSTAIDFRNIRIREL